MSDQPDHPRAAPPSPPGVAGAQSIARAADLLRLAARHGPEGARLIDLARAAALSQPTARRILKALLEEGLLVQRAGDRRYAPGPLTAELGLARPSPTAPAERWRGLAARLALRTGGAVCVQARSGPDAVCLLREDAPGAPVGPQLSPGARRPLGAGAGPLAMLAALEDDAFSASLDAAAQELRFAMAQEPKALRRAAMAVRQRGYAVSAEMFMPGVTSVGILLPQGGDDGGALSIAVLLLDPSPDRVAALAALLQEEVGRGSGP